MTNIRNISFTFSRLYILQLHQLKGRENMSHLNFGNKTHIEAVTFTSISFFYLQCLTKSFKFLLFGVRLYMSPVLIKS